MSIYGFDPARMVLLRTRTIDAVAALDDVRSTDPEAAHALRVVRLVRQNLLDLWIPVIDAIHSSTAMTSWRRVAGLDDPIAERTVARLVEQFSAISSWWRTGGLDHLDDTRLLAELGDAVEEVTAAFDGTGDPGGAWARLESLLAEASRRSQADDGAFAELAVDVDDDALVDLVERAADLDGRGLLTPVRSGSGSPGRPMRPDRLAAWAVSFLGPRWSTDSDALGRVVDRAHRSPATVDALLRSPGSVDFVVLVAVARSLVAHTTGTGAWSGRPRVTDTRERADALLRLVAAAPSAALDLLDDADTLRAVATSPRFDADAVESVVASALGAHHVRIEDASRRAERFRDLVTLTGTDELTAGAARGIARSIGPLLAEVTAHLDRRLPVLVDRGDGTGVRLGSHDEVARLLGQVLDDHRAQVTVGVAVAALRRDRRDAAVDVVRRRTDLDPARSTAVLAGHLADVTRAVELVVDGRADRDELHAFRHAMSRARAQELLGLVALGTGAAIPPGIRFSRQLTTLTTTSVTRIIDVDRPDRVPETGLDAELAIQFTTTVLEAATTDPAVRSALGLQSVPTGIWAELDALLGAIATEPDPDERAWLHGRILALTSSDPDLDAFVETVRSLSGEDRQG